MVVSHCIATVRFSSSATLSQLTCRNKALDKPLPEFRMLGENLGRFSLSLHIEGLMVMPSEDERRHSVSLPGSAGW